MEKFTEKKKLSKKKRRAENKKMRVTWDFSPTTRVTPDKTKYNRKKLRIRHDDDIGAYFISIDRKNRFYT